MELKRETEVSGCGYGLIGAPLLILSLRGALYA